jgi:N utilization substance protein B
MSNRHNARMAAVQALYQWDLTGQAADQIEKQFVQIHDMANIDKKYFREILNEVPKLQDSIEKSIAQHLDRDFARLDPVERAIFRVGSYELSHRPDVPTKVVVNEMIELAKTFGSDHSYKYVNGVMDKMAKKIRPQIKPSSTKTKK